ncbi:hypothetical protein BJ984_000547 [Herbiconiux flava]|uniref:Uncharacterized protein n=1 Tax=Herbiconiux flava TaxID=881268 RepID=A0A852SLT4_9MICO|nr:hypothetical protein [Herbiconiux flava]
MTAAATAAPSLLAMTSSSSRPAPIIRLTRRP